MGVITGRRLKIGPKHALLQLIDVLEGVGAVRDVDLLKTVKTVMDGNGYHDGGLPLKMGMRRLQGRQLGVATTQT
jgi:hypothetical protein